MSAGPNRRAPGRPGGDGPDQRERVLDAAIDSYLAEGIGGTTMRGIADRAGVNPALLHYYFGDKALLREAVVEERVMPAFEALRERVSLDGNIAQMLGDFVQGIGEITTEHPWLPALWVREVLCEGGALRDVVLARVGRHLPRAMARRFAEAQARGEINRDLDPRLLMVSLIGLTLFPIAGAPIWRRLFAADDLDFDTLRRHTLALLDGGLALDAATEGHR